MLFLEAFNFFCEFLCTFLALVNFFFILVSNLVNVLRSGLFRSLSLSFFIDGSYFFSNVVDLTSFGLECLIHNVEFASDDANLIIELGSFGL